MSLRIVRYSPPPRPPPGADPRALIWRLPIIHVAGESHGTDTDEVSTRVVEGTVRMIGDGAVRWSMVRTCFISWDWHMYESYSHCRPRARRWARIRSG